MKMNRNFVVYIATAMLPVMAGLTTFQTVQAAPAGYVNPETERVVEYWTKGRRANAIPRDLVIDPRGLGYLRKPDGSLQPYGHQIVANAQSQGPAPLAKPGGGSKGDTVPPAISNMDPNRTSISASYTFSATVTDTSGVRSVSFVIQYPDNVTTQSFSATQQSGTDTWQVSLQGFSDGNWSWWVVAKDAAPKGGNSATSDAVTFTVDTSGGSSSSGDGGSSGGTSSNTVTNAEWTSGGKVQTAAGRLYFEMPSNSKWKGPWTGYVCSGTVVDDGTPGGRSIILTASHCVYDDANKAFARNVLFIPDQADTTGAGTDLNCSNDPLGCWTPSFGVVDVNWTTRTFPDNIPWDYAFYAVSDSGSHVGTSAPSGVLDKAVAPLTIEFQAPCHDAQSTGSTCDDFTHALGYSYNDDPKFMYCAEDMTTEGAYGDWWLSSCGLSGGSSGGPWMQPVNSGDGPVISVNSWGYTNSPGMAGPRLSGTSASCVFAAATTEKPLSTADGYAGVKETCP